MSQVVPPVLSATALPSFEQAIVTVRADGTVTAWNAGATALYGLTAEEARGRQLRGLLPTVWPQEEGAIAATIADAGGWVGVLVRRNRDGDALLVLGIRARAADGGVIETSMRLPDEVAPVAVAPQEGEQSDRLLIFEPVLDDAGDIVDMTVVYANLEAAIGLGRLPADLVGRRGSELLPGYRESPMFATHRRVAVSRQRAEVADWRVELPPGSGHEHSFAGTVVPFGRGVASRSRDVTAERRALQELDDSQARVRIALAAAPVSVGQLNERLEYEWLLDNLTDLDPAEMIGRRLGARSTPGDAELLRAAAERVMATGTPERLEVSGAGALERFTCLEAVITPRREVDGRVPGVRVALVDVSEPRRLEAELRRSRDMMQAVLAQTPGAVHVVDLDGRVLFVNARAAALFGTTVEAALGRTEAELAPKSVGWIAEQDARVRRTGEHHEVRLLRGDELLLVRRFPVRDADGQIRAIGSLSIDLGRAPAGGATVTDPPAP